MYTLTALRGRATPLLSNDYSKGDDGCKIPVVMWESYCRNLRIIEDGRYRHARGRRQAGPVGAGAEKGVASCLDLLSVGTRCPRAITHPSTRLVGCDAQRSQRIFIAVAIACLTRALPSGDRTER